MNSLFTQLYVKASNAVHAFKQDQRGVTAIEYAVLAAAVVGLIAIVATAMDTGMDSAAVKLNTAINDATNAPT